MAGPPQTSSAFARSQVAVKTVLTVSLTVAAVALVAWLLSHALVSIGVFIGAALVAVALDHPIQLLQRRGVPRGLAIALVILALVAVITGIAFLLVPVAVEQIRELVDKAPELLAQLRETRLWKMFASRLGLEALVSGRAPSGGAGPPPFAAGAVSGGISAIRSIFGGAVLLFTGTFGIVMMLVFGKELIRALLAETLPPQRERYERVLGKIYGSVGGYISGLAIIAAVNAAATTAFLGIVGVPFFVPLGILSGLGSFVPFVGAILVGGLMTLLGLLTGGPLLAVGVLGYYLVYQQVENHLLAPLVYKRTIRVNPLATLFAVVIFGELAGIAGAILAVPALAICQILLREILLVRRERLNVPATGPVAEAIEEGRHP